jgi:hypothetical protein
MECVSLKLIRQMNISGYWIQGSGLTTPLKQRIGEKIMKSRYDNSPSSDAASQNARQKRFEAEHSAKDNFVKSQQAQLARHAGKAPMLKAESLEFNANMMNNGEHAQGLAKTITKGLDNVAFPVRGKAMDNE